MAPKSFSFKIPRLPPSLNVLLRMHWKKRSELQRIFDIQVRYAWEDSGRCTFLVPVKLIYILCFTSSQRRDIDNYIGGTKLITDALKRTFLFRDDSEWIKGIEVKFVKSDIEGTAIMIEALE